jgi:hypothetical protein
VLRALAIATGLALLVIGVRFLVVPERAGQFFGIGREPGPYDLHHVVALRDLWLAGILIGLAVIQAWRSLALTLLLGALVCFGDSLIALASSGRALAVLFHTASGVFCGGLAWACWRWATAGE